MDLLDILKANKDRCVGLAANMIEYNKAIICVSGGLYDLYSRAHRECCLKNNSYGSDKQVYEYLLTIPKGKVMTYKKSK